MKIDLKLPKGFLDEEPRQIRISSDVKKIWAVELDLLAKFDEVCRRNGIKYFIDGGTLLGAVRHKGFIPWDDDIDVCMFRSDFKKLEKVAVHEFQAPYFWQTFKTDIFASRGHGTLRNSVTTAIARENLVNGRTMHRFNQGIFIDVFPLDNIPDDSGSALDFLSGVQIRIDKVRKFKSFHYEFKRRGFRVLASLRGIADSGKYISTLTGSSFNTEKALEKISTEHEDWCVKYNDVKTELCCTISHWPKRKPQQYYRREWFDDVELLDFEMLKVPAPSGWSDLLTGLYGDWRKNVIASSLHGAMFFDAEKSYTEYYNQ